ncbi:uncharacterized protein LOC109837113 [Asparagus officinalis]|uniref:uncharacterized protein LOC109837113 n=1 Tax=Asparagus officinalis TaxID=4686 RepID=UPI00098E2033|nr:uncharacterized protein LOC109837113 [Asparagus officinalis]
MTFLYCKWLIVADIVTQNRRISDSEEEGAPRCTTEVTRETMLSPRRKEVAESSRKGKEPAHPTDSEEEFDSDETETSEGVGETGSSSGETEAEVEQKNEGETVSLPDSFFERGLINPSVARRAHYVALAQPQDAPKRRRERVIMTYPNRMTVEVLSGDEEEEEDTVPLARRQRSQSSIQTQAQVLLRAELRTKHCYEGSGVQHESHLLKRRKNAASKPRVRLPALEETSARSVSSDEQGSQEEGEFQVEIASPGGMEAEESSFVQQMQDTLKDETAGPVVGTDTATITGTSDQPEGHDHSSWVGTEVDFQSSIPESQPATPVDPMMIEITVTPQISPVTTKARPTEEVAVSADVVPRVESSPKRPINLDPKFSEVLIEKSSDVAGASTSIIPEPTPAVVEPTPELTSQAEFELQKLRARSNQLRVSVAKRTQAKVDLHRDLESSRAEIDRLEEQLVKAKDAHEILESGLAEITQTEENLFQQLNLQDKILAEKEQEVARIQSVDEESFKANLVPELELAYVTELS